MRNANSFYIVLVILITWCVADSAAGLQCIQAKLARQIRPGADQPSDLALAPNGDIYLVDGVNNRIVVINSKGKVRFTFGSEGSGKGQFNTPLGIDIADDGKVFVADTKNHRVQVFDRRGNYQYMFQVKTNTKNVKADPVDVLTSKIKKYIYVSDNDSHKIRVYDVKGATQFQWGKFGEEYGEFRFPGIMARNSFNEVFIVDVLNTRIQKFDPFGNFIATIGSWGVMPGHFFRPKGIAIDGKNRLFVSDSYMGVVQVFTDLGRFLGVVCENGKKRTFNTPVGLAIDKNDKLYVVEMIDSTITVLEIRN